ncbi:hypothetical protein [Jiangella mangrovi]|uniref:PpGpp synthetase/RelA/SpoT-type nucleotidyltransferase n=1 Tax=Jiangella mangrovi TaxID=1524084 RepID=A0A7W9GPP7_9ACTN|nr:hypothetical protein [Jiangella mangrovi]MBB5787775.1 ppGpp synthetase/RelA/SpoT-type nucleotidyltransferase [Jiangella mangrovi]
MPDSDGGSDRPIADGVEGLRALAGHEVPAGVDAVGDGVAGRLEGLRRQLASVDGSPALDDAERRMRGDLDRLRGEVSAALSAVADELDELRRPDPGGPGGSGAPVAFSAPTAAASAGVHPEVAAVVARLVADTAHPLDLTRALADPRRRDATLAILAELAEGRLLSGGTLEEYRAEHPGRGPLFTPVPASALTDAQGRNRLAVFLDAARRLDPARDVGADPTPSQLALLDDYGRRLVEEVEPHVRAEVEALAAPFADAAVSLRVKGPRSILEKVTRMSAGREHRPARPGYHAGAVVDAVGARITVDGTAALATLCAAVTSHFGIGDGGRVLDLENRYTDPKPHNPAYRVVPLIVAVDVGGLAYTCELQLSTRRASVAADLEHNTVYKPYVAVTEREQARVLAMQAEAAALDQDETRSDAR